MEAGTRGNHQVSVSGILYDLIPISHNIRIVEPLTPQQLNSPIIVGNEAACLELTVN